MKRLRKILKWTGIVLGILILILLVGNAIWVWTTSSRLEAKLAAIREGGDPVTLADLAGEPVPAEENAAVFLRRARAGLAAIEQELDGHWESKTFLTGRMTETEREALRSAFEAYPEVIPVLEQAAACEHYKPEFDCTAGTDAFMNSISIQEMRAAIRTMYGRALLFLAEAQRERGKETCLLMFRLSRHFEREPLLIGYLVGVACRGISVEAANEVLQAGPLSAAARQALEAELALHDTVEPYERALKTERAYGLDRFRTMPARNFWLIAQPLWNDATCYYLEMIDRHLALASRPYSEAVAAGSGTARKSFGFRGLADLTEPAIAASRRAMERSRAQVRSLRVLNAIQGYVERTGAAAPRLSDLGLPAEATTDPFTGKPLKVKKLPEGWLVYSVGPDLKDDGGKVNEMNDIGVGPPQPAGAAGEPSP